jgi:hypothetical protein
MMQHITGIPRNQLFFSSLEDTILPESSFYRCFCRSIIITNLGFLFKLKGKVDLALILKSFLKSICMVYLNGLGSKKLRKGALAISIAMACAIIPNYHSISDFRKQNPSGLKKSVQTLCFF